MFSLYQNLALKGDATEEPTAEEIKAERIKFHRQHVRNGPTSARFGQLIPAGRMRRFERRAAQISSRRQNAAYRSRWFTNEQAVARLRGQLEVIDSERATDRQRHNALTGILTKFPTLEAAQDQHERIVEERRARERRQRAEAKVRELAHDHPPVLVTFEGGGKVPTSGSARRRAKAERRRQAVSA